PHQTVLDRDLAADEIDQPPVHEVRRNPAGPLLVQSERFTLDARQPANTRTDRAAGPQPGRIVQVGKARVLYCLAGRVEPEDDERIDLPLNLVIDALAGIEPIFVIGRLHLTGDTALVFRCVEMSDGSCPALGSEDIGPGRLDITSQRGDEAQPGYDHTAHSFSPKRNRPNPLAG